jgi:hypothetical protein
VRDARQVLAATTIPLAAEFDTPDQAPLDGPGFIQFNGVGNDGHELAQDPGLELEVYKLLHARSSGRNYRLSARNSKENGKLLAPHA